MGEQPRQEQLDLAGIDTRHDAAPVSEPVQAGLFPDDSVPDELVGYRGPSACQIAGITYRQLDYWARTSLVVPSIRGAAGSGSQRLYSFKDILVLKIVKRLLDTGISLHNIRVAVDHLRRRGVEDLANITLFSDGTTVYECRSPEEVVDLLQGGQGVFGIAIGGAFKEIQGSLAALPAERPGAEAPIEPPAMTKMRRMAPCPAPMVRRMAMSRPLFFTSMMRPEMMFMAAIATIIIRMRRITLRSTTSAFTRLWFCCFQSVMNTSAPNASRSARITGWV